jgi:alanine-glyoxylate transaminase/serine-glyoxylate transaminase/serine-pyruvate transaminase
MRDGRALGAGTDGAAGRAYLAIPGPSVMPDRVLRAMHRAAPDIYAGDLHALTDRVLADLRSVAGTAGHAAIYIGNGHAAWEAAIANLFSPGDAALVLASGRFGTAWADHARAMGVAVEVIDFGRTAPADPGRLAERLRADRGGRLRAVLTTHVDTASSVRNDIAALGRAIRDSGHPALFAVDCIASLGCDPFRMDDWGVDVALAASQKGLMTPPGLGLLWVSERALAAAAGAGLRTPYWDWRPRIFATEYWQRFDGTAPTHHLYGLAEALQMILREEGLPAVWARHERLAGAVWAAFDAWGDGHPAIALNVPAPAHRGRSVTAARLGAPDATRLRAWCAREAGVTLGIGLGMAPPGDPAGHGFLRVAHMGHVNAHMTLGALAAMEAGMAALGIPHGTGGLAAAARAVAAAPAGAPAAGAG